MLTWHAYYYDQPDNAHPPVMSDWIEAASADEAIEIARGQMGTRRRAELIRPSWETPAPPLFVVSVEAHEEFRVRLN